MDNYSEKKNHVCHIILRLDIGGLERVLINLINSLSSNFTHTIICLETSSAFEQLLNKPVDIIELNKRPGREFSTHWAIFKWLIKNKPDVVQTYNLPSIEYQALSWLTFRRIRIHAEHGREIDDIDGNNRKRNLLRKISLPFVNQVVSVSTDLTFWLTNSLHVKKRKITQISNGIDTGVFSSAEKLHDSFVVGAVGRIDEVKNHGILIELCKYLEVNNSNVYEQIKFEIVGDGPELSRMRALVTQNNLSNKINFSGKSLKIVDKLNSFSLFLQPSKYEAMPMTVLEAMSCQLPIIASDVGGVSNVISHGVNGLLFNVHNLHELADQVIELFENKSKRDFLALNARKDVVCNYSCNAMANNYKKLYESVN
jgi:sugar transferase (PEP-CTERM/EpsH1 system associated)